MAEPWSLEWKEERLRHLRREWAHCDSCTLHEHRKSIVFGEGNADADIMFIATAPGEDEDAKGEPLVGPSGSLFRNMFAAAKEEWNDYYFTNLVCCRPPSNRDPVNTEKDPCWNRLTEQIYIIDPLFIVAIGKQALQFLIGGRPLAVSEFHGELMSPGASIGGTVFPQTDDNRVVHNLSYPVVPLYHPAFILRKDSFDENTGTFTAGGVADQTFADLEGIFGRLDRIKETYGAVRRAVTRRKFEV